MYDLLEHFNNYLICVEDAENYNPNDVTAEYVQEVNNRDKEVHENLYNLAAYKELDTLVFDGKEIQIDRKIRSQLIPGSGESAGCDVAQASGKDAAAEDRIQRVFEMPYAL